MDQSSDPNEVTPVVKWMKNWLPPVLIIAAAFLVAFLGNLYGDHNEEVKRNMPPDVQNSFSNCKVIEKKTAFIKAVRYHINTSCGAFETSKVRYPQIEKDAVYDLEVTHFHGGRTGYITDAKIIR